MAATAAEERWVLDTVAQYLCAGERPLPKDAQPLALGVGDLGPTLHERYLVCEKTDGVWERLLGAPSGQWWAIDRRGRVRALEEGRRPSGGVTIVDAETTPSGKQRVFTAHWVAGRDLRDAPTLDGLQAAAEMGLEAKRMRPVAEAVELVREMAADGDGGRSLGGDPVDGLIFTPKTRPTSGVLKWKFRHTVDLLVDKAGRLGCGGPGGAALWLEGAAPVGTAAGVHEFELDSAAAWRLVKARPDKDRPNYVKVVVHTLEIMAQRVTLDRIVSVTQPEV